MILWHLGDGILLLFMELFQTFHNSSLQIIYLVVQARCFEVDLHVDDDYLEFGRWPLRIVEGSLPNFS